MSRYVILVLLNLPLIVAGITGALVDYKLNKSSGRKFIISTLLWLSILAGLILAEPLYIFLAEHNLTRTATMSLFDVILFTGLIYIFYLLGRSRSKLEYLERRTNDLHQEISIRLSKPKD